MPHPRLQTLQDNTLPTSAGRRTLVRLPSAVLVLSLLIAGNAPHADDAVFKSSAVRAARNEYLTGVSAAQEDYQDALRGRREKYVESLEAAIRQATRDSDLDEANKLKAELRAVALDEQARTLAGTWRMRWNQTGYTDYTFHERGLVTRDLTGARTRGTMQRAGDEMLVDFGDGSIMRVNLAGRRLLLEYWRNKSDFASAYPNQIGVGEKVLPE